MEDVTKWFDAQTWAALAALGAFVTALVNFFQARAAARSNTTQIYLEFSNRYNSPEINEAILALATWFKSHEGKLDFGKDFKMLFDAKDQKALEVNIHRRNLNRYFLDVARAYRAGILNRQLAHLAVKHPGATVWAKVCCPMTRELYNEKTSDSLDILRKIYPDIEAGQIF